MIKPIKIEDMKPKLNMPYCTNKKCNQCGSPATEGGIFCDKCRAKLKKEARWPDD